MAPKSSQQSGDEGHSIEDQINQAISSTSLPRRPQAAQPSSRDNRLAMVEAQTVEGGVIHNPRTLPSVDGRWYWLEAADEALAREMGYADQVDVTVAREHAQVGSGIENTPNLYFIPNPAHVNPESEPEVAGDWAYLSTGFDGSAENLAWLQLGGQEQYGFVNVPRPTARQAWELREQMIDDGLDIGVFDGIDLAWAPRDPLPPVPGAPPHPNPTTPRNSPPPPDPKAPSTPGSSPGGKKKKNDPVPTDDHDPLNGGKRGGEKDQTGADETADYRSIIISTGKKFTIDASVARKGAKEPHKFMCPTKKGKWIKYPHTATFDWDDKEHIVDLNSWRDQTRSRAKFAKKRIEKRPDYPEGSKKWLFDTYAVPANGKPPGSKEIKKIVYAFNERYQQQRTFAALSALLSRLCKMFREEGGQYKEGPPRGKGNHASRPERDPSDDEKTGPEDSDDESGDEDTKMDSDGADSEGEGDGDEQMTDADAGEDEDD